MQLPPPSSLLEGTTYLLGYVNRVTVVTQQVAPSTNNPPLSLPPLSFPRSSTVKYYTTSIIPNISNISNTSNISDISNTSVISVISAIFAISNISITCISMWCPFSTYFSTSMRPSPKLLTASAVDLSKPLFTSEASTPRRPQQQHSINRTTNRAVRHLHGPLTKLQMKCITKLRLQRVLIFPLL